MAHVLTVGLTGSFKTTWNIELANQFARDGWGLIIFDPMFDNRWPADDGSGKVFKTNEFGQFWASFWNSKNCAVFIDEGGASLSRYSDQMNRLATEGRHLGHIVHIITQRGAQIALTVRDQCTEFYFFKTRKHDCKVFADDLEIEEIMDASKLQVIPKVSGECIHTDLDNFKRRFTVTNRSQ